MRGSAAMDSSLILIIQKDREKEKDSPLYPVNITVNFSFSRYSERKFPALAMGQPKRPSNRLLSPLKSRLRPIGQGTSGLCIKSPHLNSCNQMEIHFLFLCCRGFFFCFRNSSFFLFCYKGAASFWMFTKRATTTSTEST